MVELENLARVLVTVDALRNAHVERPVEVTVEVCRAIALLDE